MTSQDTPIETLKQSSADIARLLDGLSEEALTWTPGKEDWSITNIISHLWSVDRLFYGRFQHMMAEDGPTVENVDPDDLLAKGLTAQEMAQNWQKERADLCAWLDKLQPDDLDRHAMHSTRGRITIGGEMRYLLHHQAEHAEQIKTIRTGWESQQE